MGYTAHGRQQRANLVRASQLGKEFLALLRPVVATVPKTVIERTKSGSNYSSYKPFWMGVRSKKGLQTGHKDFYFSGEMWNSYQIVAESITDVGVSYTLGTNGGVAHQAGKFLSDIHSKNEGMSGDKTILDLTDEEWKKLEEEMWVVINKTYSGLIK